MWTYEWRDDYQVPFANHEVAHQCVDWPKLEGWAQQHAFSIHDDLIRWPNGELRLYQ